MRDSITELVCAIAETDARPQIIIETDNLAIPRSVRYAFEPTLALLATLGIASPAFVATQRNDHALICVGMIPALSRGINLSDHAVEINDLTGRLLGEALPAVHLAHRDLARSQQGPEQYRGSLHCPRRFQHARLRASRYSR
jgi:hypothetical protein